MATIREFNLDVVLDTPVADLSYGQRRMVAIARAMASRPALLLLDEPAAGLSDADTRALGATLRRLVDAAGVGVLLVEHDLHLVSSICDELVVLEFGFVLHRGAPKEVLHDHAVVAAYVGDETTATIWSDRIYIICSDVLTVLETAIVSRGVPPNAARQRGGGGLNASLPAPTPRSVVGTLDESVESQVVV